MVKAKYTVEEDIHTLTVLGHANYAEYGKDIVCAGVSSLVQALIGWIEEYSWKVECISTDPKDGEIVISAVGGEDTAAAFQMTAIGLEQIAYCYPDYVQIDVIGLAD